jgi:RNA polymerase sigma-70 factor (ECF subfamily)
MNSLEFEKLIKQTKAAVLAAIRDTLSPSLSHMIDDVVQETYLKAYNKLTKSTDIQNIYNYLYTIAKNESIRINKKEKRLTQLASDYVDYQQQFAKDDDTDNKQDFFPALQKVSPAYQAVVQLIIRGFSLKEISEKLNIKMGTVKSKLHRAKFQIKQEMRENKL